MKIMRVLGAATLMWLGLGGNAGASSHSEAPSMAPFQTFWLHFGGGVGRTGSTTFRDQNPNDPNAFFGPDLLAPADSATGAIFSAGISTPIGGPFRGAVKVFHGANFNANGPVQFADGFPFPGDEIFSADVRFTKAEVWVYADINKLIPLPSFIEPFVGAGAGVTYNHLSNVRSTFTSGPATFTATLPSGSTTNFTWGFTAGVGFPIRDENGRTRVIFDLSYLYQDLGEVRSGAGEGSFSDGIGSFQFPVAPVQADVNVQAILLAMRIPLNEIVRNLLGAN